MSKLTPTSAKLECPVCGRTKDGDCRIGEQGNLILCHTFQQDTGKLENGYKFIRESTKAHVTGVWAWDQRDDRGLLKGKKIRPRIEPRQIFDYPDRGGNKLVRVMRQKGGQFEFWQEYFVDGTWKPAGKVSNELKTKMRSQVPIYRYREVQTAIERRETIVFVEGETTANALWEIGIPATTTIGGSNGLNDWGDYSNDLAGADIAISPDRDRKGMEYADAVKKMFPQSKLLKAYPKSLIWQVALPDDGGLDLADWIQDGATKEEILGAIEVDQPLPIYKSMPEVALGVGTDPEYDLYRRAIASALAKQDPTERDFLLRKVSSKFGVPFSMVQTAVDALTAREATEKVKTYLTLNELLNEADTALEWIIPGFLPKGETVLLTAKPKVGKTLLSYEAARAVATGGVFLNEIAKQGKVLIVQCEEGRFTLRSRMLSFNMDDVDGDVVRLLTQFDVTRDLPRLESILEDFRPSLVIIDSIRKINSRSRVEENSAEFAKPIYAISDLVRDYNASAILIHHDRKSTGDKDTIGIDNVAGHSALVGATWGSWRLLRTSPNEDDPKRHLAITVRGTRGSRHMLQLEEGDGLTFNWEYGGEIGLDPTDKSWQDRIIACLAFYAEKGREALNIFDLREYLGLAPGSKELNKPLNRAIERQLISCKKDPNNRNLRWYSLPSTNNGGQPTPPLSTNSVKNPSKSTQTQSGREFRAVDSTVDSKNYSVPLSETDVAEILADAGFQAVDRNGGQERSEIVNSAIEIALTAIALYLTGLDQTSIEDCLELFATYDPNQKREVWDALPGMAQSILSEVKAGINGGQETGKTPCPPHLSTVQNRQHEKALAVSTSKSERLVEGGGSPFREVNGIVEYNKNAKPRGKSLPIEMTATEEAGLKVGDRVLWANAPSSFAFAQKGVQIVRLGNGVALLDGVTGRTVPIVELQKITPIIDGTPPTQLNWGQVEAPIEYEGFRVGDRVEITIEKFPPKMQKQIRKNDGWIDGRTGTIVRFKPDPFAGTTFMAVVAIDGDKEKAYTRDYLEIKS